MRTYATVAALVAAHLAIASDAIVVWEKVSARVKPANERLQAVPYTSVAVNHTALVEELASDAPTLEFVLPGRAMTCTVAPSSVMHADLAAKFSTIKSLSGSCTDGSDVSLNIDTATIGSLEVTFYTPEGRVYADEISGGIYMVYSHSDAQSKGIAPEEDFRCVVNQKVARELAGSSRVERSRRQTQSEAVGYKFRIAVLANRQYGAFHGGTSTSIMLAIVKTMVRVNGVYIRELGVYFELIPENDKLLCVQGDTTCASWPNNGLLVGQNSALMLERGVTAEMYDIGHSLSTSSGGFASYPSLCTSNKAEGTTGIARPFGDMFWIDYVAHEIGHQMFGAHTFRDCYGRNDGNMMEEGAVEPGGGVTIMGYAGICGSNNVQSNSVPHFNSVNLAQMRDFIEGKVADGCGETFFTGRERPVVSTKAKQCVAPKGNYVQLSGQAQNMDSNSLSYAWDRVDLGYKDFTDVNVPRFRPWSPGPSPSRFLPNMYYLTYGLGQQMGEVPPNPNVPGDEEMTFRFIARSKYERTAEQSSFDIKDVGAFGFQDVSVQYIANEEPLVITSQLLELEVGTTVNVTWTGGSLSSSVKIMLAVNVMTQVSYFRYEEHVKDLEWVSIATVPNNGSTVVTIPELTTSPGQEVNLMLRSTGNEDCYFFDLVPRLPFVGVNPTLEPTPSPNATSSPKGWLCEPSSYGNLDGCNCDCGVRDPDCNMPFAVIHCKNGSYLPSIAECSADINTCAFNSDSNSTSPPGSSSEQSLQEYIIVGAGVLVFAVAVGLFITRRPRDTKAHQQRKVKSGSLFSADPVCPV